MCQHYRAIALLDEVQVMLLHITFEAGATCSCNCDSALTAPNRVYTVSFTMLLAMQNLIYCVCEYMHRGNLYMALANDQDDEFGWYEG